MEWLPVAAGNTPSLRRHTHTGSRGGSYADYIAGLTAQGLAGNNRVTVRLPQPRALVPSNSRRNRPQSAEDADDLTSMAEDQEGINTAGIRAYKVECTQEVATFRPQARLHACEEGRCSSAHAWSLALAVACQADN